MDFMNIILMFEVDKLDSDWVEAQWNADFTEEAELPPDFDDCKDYGELLDAFSDWVKRWVELKKKGQGEMGGKYWRDLVENHITPKALVAFISSFLKSGVNDLRECKDQREPFSAARAYLSLLAIEGGSAFNVFHPELFRKTLEIFKLLNDVLDKNTLAPAKRNRKRRDEGTQNEDEAEQDEACQKLSDKEVKEMLPVLIDTLDALLLAVNNGFELRCEPDTLTLIILSLIPFAKLEKNSTTFFTSPPSRSSFTLFVYLVYEILRGLCQSCHGDVVDTFRQIANSFMSILSFSSKEFGNEDEKVKNVVRSHVTAFLISLSTSLGPSSEEVLKSIVQSLCITCPDKADGRAKCVQNIVSLLYELPCDSFNWCLLWIISLCHSDSFKNRVTGIEIVVKVLHTEERQDEPSDDVILISHDVLLTCLIGRFEDNSPVVRAKCLSAFSALVLSSDRRIRRLMESLFVTPYKTVEELITEFDSSERGVFQFQKYFKKRLTTELRSGAILPGGTVVFHSIEKFVGDEKANVSRSALNTLCNIYRLSSKWITPKRIGVLLEYCRASSVMIRKMLVQALTDILLAYPSNPHLIRAWVLGIIPLVGDNERRSVDKVFEVSTTVILNNFVSFDSIKNDHHLLALKILGLILECNYRHHFGVICQQWSSENKFTKHFIKTVKTYIGTEYNLSAWFLLVSISEQQDISADFIAEYYLENIHSNMKLDEATCMLVMEALDLNAKQLKDYREDLADKLWTELSQFSVPLPLISPSMNIMFKFNSEQFRRENCKQLISMTVSYLKRKIKSNSLDKTDENVLSQYIFTLGEAALFDGQNMENEIVDSLKQILEKNGSNDLEDSSVSSKVKAVAVTTLTKFCLQDQIVAKTIVPTFGNLLDTPTPSCIKINALVAFTDLCIRFTSLIEPYLGDVCLCLKDELKAVRKKTLTLIMQLAQEDYIKLRFPYFYYILTMLLDEDESIGYQTNSFIKNAVLVKNNKIMGQELLQAIYFFNDDPERSKGIILSTKEREAFCLPGEKNKEKRRKILRYMVDHTKEASKLKIAAVIAEEIIEPVSEGKFSLNGRGADDLQDALFILSCEEFKIRALSGAGRDDNEDEEGRESEAGALQMNLLKQVLQRTLLESLLPALIKLKKKLVEMKSPLVHDAMHALKETVKDFKKELNELLSGDPVTAAELEVELRSYMADEEDEALQAPPTVMPSRQDIYQTMAVAAELFMDESSTGAPDPMINEMGRVNGTPALIRNSVGSRRNSKAINQSRTVAASPTACSVVPRSSKTNGVASDCRSSSSCSSGSTASPVNPNKKKKKKKVNLRQ